MAQKAFAITIDALDRRQPLEMSALAKLNSKGELTIPKEILDDLELAPEGITFEHSSELKLRSAETSRPTADIADYLIAGAASKSGCGRTMTFDKQAATRAPGMELLA